MTPFIAPALSREDVFKAFSPKLWVPVGSGIFSQHITAESLSFSAGIRHALVRFRRRGVLGDPPPAGSHSALLSCKIAIDCAFDCEIAIDCAIVLLTALITCRFEERKEQNLAEPYDVHQFPYPVGFDTNDQPSSAKILLI